MPTPRYSETHPTIKLILKIIERKPCIEKTLVTELRICQTSIHRAVKWLHDLKRIHIYKWFSHRHGNMTPVYAVGESDDAKRPLPVPSMVRCQLARDRKNPWKAVFSQTSTGESK